MSSPMARISVITATLNRRELLRAAIDSVVAQGLDGVEHIVVDGMSTDGTAEMLSAYSHLVVVREPDKNVYQAWNKGIRRATGDIVCILNSDDEIPVGTFARVREAFASAPGVELVSGAVELATLDGSAPPRIVDDPRLLSLREQDIGPGVPITNGRYFSSGLVQRVGLFDERYAVVSDRDYLLRVLLAKPRHVVIADPVYRYRIHAESLTMSPESSRGRYVAEALQAARAGLTENASASAREAYARWHAWASLYAAGLSLGKRDISEASRTAMAAFRLDPVWPLRTIVPLIRHLWERDARRGHTL